MINEIGRVIVTGGLFLGGLFEVHRMLKTQTFMERRGFFQTVRTRRDAKPWTFGVGLVLYSAVSLVGLIGAVQAVQQL